MNWIAKHLKRMSQEELYTLIAALDDELEVRTERRVARGYRRSTYFCDIVRGKRRAPRWAPSRRKAA